ncbi:DeoR/GlpR family DNA-binding transcription regulator [Agromyces aerolatus]|uniref:DeoR/GlpR family DNA-binding transcription regulator n=1 Tax=Agromyces sp. LY-1074 TaxID=3074080 RepID=UPI002854FD46|nr:MULTISPECIES: DeoR/GlpR family DNA-binding transcription regulator [unclassified Agromyces]MDR5698255.1 DeoR/GlpR family DNA-binding transcription regulator [Agromyces sp. LY-1074]MDR5704549.1 DeoR/GlpR family DNA-binding transcription regulator [Agromyces sp. LY-1358]
MTDAPDAASRRELALALVLERGFVRVADLAATFGVTPVTARADLDALERAGAIRRVHGGAVPLSGGHGLGAGGADRPEREPTFEEALEASVRPKQAIGETAAGLVRSGQSVILDVGTTTLQIARALRRRADLDDVTIFTNGLSIALELEPEIPRFTVVVTGGTLRPRQHSLVHPLAGSMFDEIHVDLAFIGGNGVDAVHGFTNANLPEAQVKALMLRAAARAVIVADASKLGEVHLGRIAPVDAFSLLITDPAAPEVLIEEFEALGLPVLVAGAPSAGPQLGGAQLGGAQLDQQRSDGDEPTA